jgi:sec-independent protein translocase protein TatA
MLSSISVAVHTCDDGDEEDWEALARDAFLTGWWTEATTELWPAARAGAETESLIAIFEIEYAIRALSRAFPVHRLTAVRRYQRSSAKHVGSVMPDVYPHWFSKPILPIHALLAPQWESRLISSSRFVASREPAWGYARQTRTKGRPVPNIGPTELIVVLVIALLILGPKKLPAAGRGLGEGIRGFKESLTNAKPNLADLPAPTSDTAESDPKPV